jgi:hypothetical protein
LVFVSFGGQARAVAALEPAEPGILAQPAVAPDDLANLWLELSLPELTSQELQGSSPQRALALAFGKAFDRLRSTLQSYVAAGKLASFKPDLEAFAVQLSGLRGLDQQTLVQLPGVEGVRSGESPQTQKAGTQRSHQKQAELALLLHEANSQEAT